jgi:hypothetical protein
MAMLFSMGISGTAAHAAVAEKLGLDLSIKMGDETVNTQTKMDLGKKVTVEKGKYLVEIESEKIAHEGPDLKHQLLMKFKIYRNLEKKKNGSAEKARELLYDPQIVGLDGTTSTLSIELNQGSLLELKVTPSLNPI